MSSPAVFDINEYGDIHLDASIETPSTLEDKVSTLSYIHGTGRLPENFEHLTEFFDRTYDAVYDGESTGYFEDPDLDLAFQQFAIKRDEDLNRSQVITFGTFLPAYNLAMVYRQGSQERYLGRFNGEQEVAQTLLLGCSSITSAQEYMAMVKTVNPNAVANIVDINPTIIETLKATSGEFSLDQSSQNQAINTLLIPEEDQDFYEEPQPTVFRNDVSNFSALDATNLAESNIPDGSQDMIFTSMLVNNLLTSGKAEQALSGLFNGVAAKLKPGGRFVLVESLSTQEMIDLDQYAYLAGLSIQGPQGRNTKAEMIKKGRKSINQTLKELEYEFDEDHWEKDNRNKSISYPPDNLYGGRGFATRNEQQTGVSLLIFEKPISEA
jgi:hypothetical protein